MSQLILLRQRIKAIETIQKITHAMRLISMSSHAHLKNAQNSFEAYTRNLKQILTKIQKIAPQTEAINGYSTKILICVFGSQKGLAGTFNNALIHYFNRHIQSFDQSRVSLFLVGKKIIDALTPDYRNQIIAEQPQFSLRTVPDIVAKISSTIESFDRVIVMHNTLESFFIQKPTMTTIMPLEWKASTDTSNNISEYEWEMNAHDIFESLIKEYKHTSLEHLLLKSLLAEHAARFIAMDNSTRNARTLLEEKKLEYNKLRQAKITKELTELSGIFTL